MLAVLQRSERSERSARPEGPDRPEGPVRIFSVDIYVYTLVVK